MTTSIRNDMANREMDKIMYGLSCLSSSWETFMFSLSMC